MTIILSCNNAANNQTDTSYLYCFELLVSYTVNLKTSTDIYQSLKVYWLLQDLYLLLCVRMAVNYISICHRLAFLSSNNVKPLLRT